MKVFIIGNGFDIGHKLNTQYWDFRKFLEGCYPHFLNAFESNYNIYPRTSEDEKKNLLWNELESNLANIDEDIIIENAVSIDMGLESGDIGIEDTLYQYFSDEFNYIDKLSYYIKLWVRGIKIRDIPIRTKMFDLKSKNIYITFNYTSVLENVYKIPQNRIIHIHGSLRNRDGNPIIGHGNYKRIEDIKERQKKADEVFDEKKSSISRVIEDYYSSTYKNINRYRHKLNVLKNQNIDEIIVIGHSLSGVDMPYFTTINHYATNEVKWKIYYYDKNRKNEMYINLIKCGIKKEQIDMRHSTEFYDV